MFFYCTDLQLKTTAKNMLLFLKSVCCAALAFLVQLQLQQKRGQKEEPESVDNSEVVEVVA